MSFFDSVLDKLGHVIAKRLQAPSSGYEPFTPPDPERLSRILCPGDVILVEGNQKISAAIKYLTQSTWSHAALYIGDALGETTEDGEVKSLIEVNIGEGCVAVPLSKYITYNLRICRPKGLSEDDRRKVIAFAIAHLGIMYDTRNIIDLARYLFPTPPVPVRFRRRMIALGAGEPTRAVCSTLIASAFQSIGYPILPRIERVAGEACVASHYSQCEIYHIRHHSLFAPRDFDISPYFEIVKPTLVADFDYKAIRWGSEKPGEGALAFGRPRKLTRKNP